MSSTLKFDEGATYEFVVHGAVICILGFLFMLFHWSITLVFLLLGIAMMGIKTGIELDVQNCSIRKYKNLLGLRFGKWFSLNDYAAAELHFNAQTTSSRTFVIDSDFFPIGKSTKTVQTYDLVLVDKEGKAYLFNPFLKFGIALKTINALRKIEHLSVQNFVENWLNKKSFERRR